MNIGGEQMFEIENHKHLDEQKSQINVSNENDQRRMSVTDSGSDDDDVTHTRRKGESDQKKTTTRWFARNVSSIAFEIIIISSFV